MAKCENCGEEVTRFFILWRKGTKEKRGRNVAKDRDPKLVCMWCLEAYPGYEVISEYG